MEAADGQRIAAKVPRMKRYEFPGPDGVVHGSYSAREHKALLQCMRKGAVTTHSQSGIVGLVLIPNVIPDGCIWIGEGSGAECIIFTHFVVTLSFGQLVNMRAEQEFVRLKSYAVCMLQAISRLHSLGMVHGDIKADNFLYEGHRIGLGSFCDMNFSGRADSGFL